ncbi:MAG: hypothetical protein HQL69_12580 [Magnetococcales bacterium]|nr:hypothetical protein [Magnetococcales bacterium]
MANIIFGLVALALGLWGVSVWWWSIVEILRGIVPIALILLGLVALGAGVTKMRDKEHDDGADYNGSGEFKDDAISLEK